MPFSKGKWRNSGSGVGGWEVELGLGGGEGGEEAALRIYIQEYIYRNTEKGKKP